MRPLGKETDEARFRRAELRLLKRAHHRRHLDMVLGGLLIAAIVAVIFWLIGLSPPPREPESANEPRPQRQSVAGTATPVSSASSAIRA